MSTWVCGICTFENPIARTMCEMCGTNKPASTAATTTAATTTTSAPTTSTSAASTTTTSAASTTTSAASTDSSASSTTSSATTSTTTSATTSTTTSAASTEAATSSTVSSATTTATTSTGPWNCEKCTYSNSAAQIMCEMCGNPKPGFDASRMAELINSMGAQMGGDLGGMDFGQFVQQGEQGEGEDIYVDDGADQGGEGGQEGDEGDEGDYDGGDYDEHQGRGHRGGYNQ